MPETDFETIQWSYDEETNIGRIVLDRPKAHNALSSQLKRDIIDGFAAFEAIDEDNAGITVRAVIVEGAGEKAFSAGADISEFGDENPAVADQSTIWDVCEDFGAPVVAKIDGFAFGGGLELALSCDFRIASERSKLGLTEVNIGLIPGGGGTQRIAEIVGTSRAKEICMTGEHIPASQAHEEGLVNEVHPAGELEDEVVAFTEEIASNAPLAVRALKDVINYTQESALEEGRRYEYRACMQLFGSADQEEGAAAFMEDREPEWTGE